MFLSAVPRSRASAPPFSPAPAGPVRAAPTPPTGHPAAHRRRLWTRPLARLVTVCLAAPMLAALMATGTPPGVSDDVGNAARAGQWQLSALGLSRAWRQSKGDGVLVAVLDTGVDGRHPDLDGSVVNGPDLTGAPRNPDMWGHHGTAMASLIAGHGHGKRDGTGLLGVAPRARVLSVRVTLENGDPLREKQRRGGRDALAEGIRYAADHGADVISMSLGGRSGTREGSAAEESAVRYALARGAVLVASSGNDGDSANRKNFPAAYPGVIAVGAVDRRLRVAPFSNRQNYLSVVAPGTGIVTADGPDSYVVGDGTSSAAAMVAGVAALIKAVHPELSPQDVRTAIERGTRRRPAKGHNRTYGYGLVNAPLALRAAGVLAGVPSVPASRLQAAAPPPGPWSRTPVVLGMLVLAAAMSAHIVVRNRRRRRGSP